MKKLRFISFISLFLYSFSVGFSQTTYATGKQSAKKGNKGKFYVYHGWNRGSYTNSDIQFKGENFNFSIYDVQATDRAIPFSLNPYLNPLRFTEVQTNSRIGYYFHDHYTISLGSDHMKYVMTNGQTVKIDGTINTGTEFDKTYQDEDIVLTEDFLKFEHTNGLNLVNIEINRVDDILQQWMKVDSKNIQVNLIEGMGVGFLLPHTDVTLLNFPQHARYNLAGYGISAKAGLNITFFEHFFIQAEIKEAWLNMPDIRISTNDNEKASQHFWALQRILVFGGSFRLGG